MSQIPVVQFSSFIPDTDALPVQSNVSLASSSSSPKQEVELKQTTIISTTDPATNPTTSGNSSPRKRLYGVFGLGNPGDQFKGTRHNIGREIIERMSDEAGLSLRAKGVEATHVLSSNKTTYVKSILRDKTNDDSKYEVILATPNTFMNLSGISVRGLCDKYAIYDKNTIVVYDDIDLPLGTIRLKNSGSSGGQKGVEDIIRRMTRGGRASKFIRVRVGVGTALGKKARGETVDFVLGRFHGSNELPLVEKTMKRVAACVQMIITQGVEMAQNYYNSDAAGFAKAEAKAQQALQAKSAPSPQSPPIKDARWRQQQGQLHSHQHLGNSPSASATDQSSSSVTVSAA